MAASREVIYLDRFNGGLNLSRQAQYLSPSETPDCLNVDFDLRGGFSTRAGFVGINDNALLADAWFLGPVYFDSDVVLLQHGVDLVEWSGSAATDTAVNITDNTSERVRMATFGNKAYFANGRLTGNLVMRSWDGTSLSTLTNAFNDDYTLPNNGDMPLARLITAHKTHMFVGDTTEGGNRFPQRIRYSHLGFPEDWANDDSFEVGDTDDGNPITALLSFVDHLLIFTHTSIHALYGYDKDSWVLDPVTQAIGVRNQDCVTASGSHVYMFTSEGNVVSYDGRQFKTISEPLEYGVRSGAIDPSEHGDLVWGHDKLFLITGTGPSITETHFMFVWDMFTQTWTKYSPQVHSMLYWRRIDEQDTTLFIFHNDDDIYVLDDTADTDIIEGVEVPFQAYYRTAWMTAGETATKKRWKRPRISAAANSSMILTVDVFHNFNESTSSRTHFVPIVNEGGGGVWGDDWGVLLWAGVEEAYEFERLPASGSAYTVQYLFSATEPTRWWVDSLAVPFRRKQVK